MAVSQAWPRIAGLLPSCVLPHHLCPIGRGLGRRGLLPLVVRFLEKRAGPGLIFLHRCHLDSGLYLLSLPPGRPSKVPAHSGLLLQGVFPAVLPESRLALSPPTSTAHMTLAWQSPPFLLLLGCLTSTACEGFFITC